MTEAEWLQTNQILRMADQLDLREFDRKLRLFAVACCRVAWTHLAPPARQLVDASEDYADGRISLDGLRWDFDTTPGRDQSVDTQAVRSGAALDCASWWASSNKYVNCALRITAHVATEHLCGPDRGGR
jgi:hypothetical protein